LWHIWVGVVADKPLVHNMLGKHTAQGALALIESKEIT